MANPHGNTNRSLVQKCVLQASSFGVAILESCWLLKVGPNLLSLVIPNSTCDPLRAIALAGCSVLYSTRLFATSYLIDARGQRWDETIVVSAFLSFCKLWISFFGGWNATPINRWQLGLAVCLVVFGSFLNTGSEVGRWLWKRKVANKGKCYTQGLFKYATHINYTGDVLLFSGNALVAGKLWAFLVPAVMLLGFVFQHIPQLDEYLSKKYPNEFPKYQKRTAKLVPFFY